MSFTLQIAVIMGFPSGSRGEESACHADDLSLIPQEDPLEKGVATHS